MQVLQISILISVQYLQNVVFSFEKSFNSQKHFFPDSHHPVKNPPSKISHPLLQEGRFLLLINTIWKTLGEGLTKKEDQESGILFKLCGKLLATSKSFDGN